jgi:hypothetical protein
MKKLLGILVLGLLFISIDLSNPTTVKAETLQELINRTHMSKTEKFFHKLNPLNYFEKRKECKEDAEVKARILNLPKLEKEHYKECMED